MAAEAARSRLERILVLVPWVLREGDVGVEEVCERFGITRDELMADLDLLFVCGLPPFGPGDLIEAQIAGDRVVIRMADYLAEPMRLSYGEALALLLAGRALARLPGLEEAGSLRRALGKLEEAVAPGAAEAVAEIAERVAVELEGMGADRLALLREAIAGRQTLRVEYYSSGRDALTERDLDPLVVFSGDGHWYLVAHDHESDEERVFRVDRIKDAAPTGARFEPPEGFDPRAYEHAPLYTPSADDIEVTIEVGPDAAWVLETMPHDRAEPLGGGWRRVVLRTARLAWLVRLLLLLAEQARAIEPPELREALREAAGRALARYRAS